VAALDTLGDFVEFDQGENLGLATNAPRHQEKNLKAFTTEITENAEKKLSKNWKTFILG
jgi:hypothetical protein